RPISEGRVVLGARRGVAQNIRRQPRGGQAAFGGGRQSSGRSGILVDEKGRGSGSCLDRRTAPLLVESQLSTVPLGATLRIACSRLLAWGDRNLRAVRGAVESVAKARRRPRRRRRVAARSPFAAC